MSQALNSASTKPSSADPQEEPILIEPTDASKTVEDENPSTSIPDVAKVSPKKFLILIQFLPFSNHLSRQILPEEMFTQEQESDSLPIENDFAVADIQTVDPQVQHTTDGKKVICLVYFSAKNTN